MAAVASWRWRDALFEGPFGQSPGRTKFAEPSSYRAVRFHPSLSKGDQPPATSLSGVRVRRAREADSLHIHQFWCAAFREHKD